jgi:hypothetical protein
MTSATPGRASAASLALALALAAPVARADETAATRSAAAARGEGRPYTMAEVGVGLLTLPGADVCVRANQCTKSDTTVAVSLWQFYRPGPTWGLGAGVTFALQPSTDEFRAGEGSLQRTHGRSYFLIEGQGRWYALHLPALEAWLGATAGLVVLSDRYSVETKNQGTQPALLGPRSSTLRTEGAAAGALFGFASSFAANWSAGATFRAARWYLPTSPATSGFGDTATLTGSQNVLDVMFAVSYRIAL